MDQNDHRGGPFAAISCPTGSACTAIDAFGLASQFDAYGWHAPVAVDLPNTLTSVSCPSTAFCTAVGVAGQAMTYNGATWAATVSADNAGGINGVSCGSSASCAAVGLADAVCYSGTRVDRIQDDRARNAADGSLLPLHFLLRSHRG